MGRAGLLLETPGEKPDLPFTVPAASGPFTFKAACSPCAPSTSLDRPLSLLLSLRPPPT